MHARVNTRMHVRVNTRMHARVQIRATRTRTRTHEEGSESLSLWSFYLLRLHEKSRIYICVCTHVGMYVYIKTSDVYKHKCKHSLQCFSLYLYIRMYILTYVWVASSHPLRAYTLFMTHAKTQINPCLYTNTHTCANHTHIQTRT
jgi:hypothetical protein